MTMFILAGRYSRSGPNGRPVRQLRALLELGAKDVAEIARGGIEVKIGVDELSVGDEFVVRPGRRWPPTVSSFPVSRPLTCRC